MTSLAGRLVSTGALFFILFAVAACQSAPSGRANQAAGGGAGQQADDGVTRGGGGSSALGGGGSAGSGERGDGEGGGHGGASSAGAGGGDAVGGATGEIGPGVLVACPSSLPAGACAIEGLACPYATTKCTCKAGTWTCSDCPPARPPPPTTMPPPDGDRCFDPFACRYDPDTGLPSSNGALTCSCGACGQCPAAHPTPGAACADPRLACGYGAEICACDATRGSTWTCLTPTCPAAPTGGGAGEPGTCGGMPEGHVCRYADVDQNCACAANRQHVPTLSCSCPAAAPAEGSACLETPAPCDYIGWSCTCTAGPDGGRWHCGTSCPPGPPLNGPCKDRLVCD
ncbi:MAG TPA: hypothetical protein VIU64_18815, partial [Polyangia bacterium]